MSISVWCGKHGSKDSKWRRLCERVKLNLSLSLSPLYTKSTSLILNATWRIGHLRAVIRVYMTFSFHPLPNLALCYGKSNRNITTRGNEKKRKWIGRKERRAHLPQSYEQILPNDSSKITQNDPILNLTTPFFILHSHGFYVKNVFFSAIFHSYSRSLAIVCHISMNT